MDKVSVLIPAYNAERFLARCIESILKQTYKELEIIIINDGSKDNTLGLCNKYKEQDKRIRVINQPNRGVAATRNVCLKNVTGDYILFVDADDWIEHEMIECLMNAIHENDAVDIAYCSYDNAEKPMQVEKVSAAPSEIWNKEKQQEEFLIHQRITGMLWNKLIRTQLFEGVCFDETVGYGEDAQVLWKVLKNSRNMVVLHERLYHHVLDKQSISHQQYSKAKYSAIKVWLEVQQDVNEHYPEWRNLAQKRLVDAVTYTYYEMKCSGNYDKEEKKQLTKIIRNNIGILFKKSDMSWKMKCFAFIVVLGI